MFLGLPALAGTPDKVRRVVDGQVVVVSGASRGIGRELARRLAGVGAQVVGIARASEDLAATAAEITGRGGWFQPLAGDLRDLDWAQQAGRQIVDEYGAPAVLVSNAGHSIHRRLADYTGRFHDVTRTIGVNYLGAVGLALPVVRAMMDQGRGHLVSVSTISMDLPMPNWSVYTASKGAYDQWLKCISPELKVAGVAATSIHFPRVSTAMSAPTAGRYPFPELTVGQAADVVCRCIVTRPRVAMPWWSRLTAAVSSAWPESIQRVWEIALRAGARP